MKIISVKLKSKRNPNIFLIETDGETYEMHSDIIVKNKINVGEVDDEIFFESVVESEEIIALNLSMKYLNGRMKTEKQMRDYLFKHEFRSSVVNYVVDKLKEYSLIDDRAYVQAYIKSNLSYSKNKMKQKLYAFGIKSDVVNEESVEVDDEESCLKNANKFLKNKVMNQQTKEKLIRRLLNLGYNWDSIKKTLSKLKIDMEEE